jgi:hypothetical protein
MATFKLNPAVAHGAQPESTHWSTAPIQILRCGP